jgi:hypothetical protein
MNLSPSFFEQLLRRQIAQHAEDRRKELLGLLRIAFFNCRLELRHISHRAENIHTAHCSQVCRCGMKPHRPLFSLPCLFAEYHAGRSDLQSDLGKVEQVRFLPLRVTGRCRRC